MNMTFLPKFVFAILLASSSLLALAGEKPDYQRAQWDPIHFKPAIETATDEQCLRCHQEIIDKEIRASSPAGMAATRSRAWYQLISTYQGPQMDFHRRHLDGPMAKQFMRMKCNTCHQGHDPREEAPGASANQDQATTAFTLRKAVNPEICHLCHGQMDYQNMGLPEPWPRSAKLFANNCLTCHTAIRTKRHQVNYLQPEEIEQAGAKNSDVCFGCHGGRAWYRTSYPYPRHAWEGMPEEVPEWAKNRPTESQQRFRRQELKPPQ